MSVKSVLAELKAMGTAQNRKVYARHGVGSKAYGVSYANLAQLKKKIKQDQALAERLWQSGNHDARVLATMIADPAKLTASALDRWVKHLDNYVATDAFSSLASRAPSATTKMKKWIRSTDEWIATAGWNIVAHAAMRDDAVPEAFFRECIDTIATKIHKSKNRVRYSMNGALISIGMRNAKLEKHALAAAKRIGRVDVDHGETGCKTPDAATYIVKNKARSRARQAKRKPSQRSRTSQRSA